MITVAYAKNRNADIGLFVLRVVVGIVFFAHGWQKFFMLGIDATTAGFAQMGIPFPQIAAPFVAGLELIGGLGLILGLWTRLFTWLLAINMLVAILLVHLSSGFFLPGGMEFALTLMAACVALALSGPGAISVDGVVHDTGVAEVTEFDRIVTRERRDIGVNV